MEFKVVDINGKETGKSVKLNASVFGIEPNEHSIYLDVKQFLANARQGTHKSKERGEINRTTKSTTSRKVQVALVQVLCVLLSSVVVVLYSVHVLVTTASS